MRSTLIILFLFLSHETIASECRELIKPFIESNSSYSVINLKTDQIDITKFGLSENPINRSKFERLYSQCLSPDKNSVKDLASKKLSNIFIGMSAATTITGYTQQNWKKEKNLEWFERLGYSLTFGAICGTVYKKLIHDDGSRFQYLIKDYIFGRGAIIAFFGGSSLLFNNDKVNIEKINKLKNSKTFNDDIKKLQKYAQDEKLYERYKKELITHLSNQEEISLGLGIHGGVDFDHLKPSDLQDPAIQKVVIASILAQEYEHNKSIIKTGSTLGDFFLFDSVYSIIKIPKDILVNKMTNQVMCLNMHNPARGLTQAIGINTFNQIIFADYYGVTYTLLQKEFVGSGN